jgi:hypothetical protein
MSTIRNPVGPQPPNVYWRRRLLLLLGAVAVIVVILLIVFAPKGGSPSAAETKSASPHASAPNPDPSFSGGATTGATAGAAAACDPSVITLTPVTDATSYAANAQPQLSMSITNSGAKACTLDVGTSAQDYIITSGADAIWNSADCQTNPSSDVRTLQPGKALTTTPFAWDRTRSSKDTCSSTNKTAVVAGGASYHLQVKVGKVTSSGTKQFILN